jgi:hypothetical protein
MDMDAPFLYKEKENVVWSLRQVLSFVKTLEQLNCLDDFLDAAEKKGLDVEIPKETINYAKMYLFDAGHHKSSSDAKKYISSGIGATCRGRGGPPGPI